MLSPLNELVAIAITVYGGDHWKKAQDLDKYDLKLM